MPAEADEKTGVRKSSSEYAILRGAVFLLPVVLVFMSPEDDNLFNKTRMMEMRKEKDIMAVSKSVSKSVKKKEQPSRSSSAKKTVKTKTSERNVKFSLPNPAAGEVCLAGDFNNWDTCSTPLKKGKNGTWSVSIKLLPGRYEYNFFVDGNWVCDTCCLEMVTNSFGTQNSVIMVE